MRVVLVSGSHRLQSQSEKVAQYLASRWAALYPEAPAAEILLLAGNPLPLWDEGVWEKTPQWQEAWAPYSRALLAADAFVFVVPEWGGMAPPGFKNFLLLCTQGEQELAHKPALLVTVSAGQGGSYPVMELRASGYKNSHVNYLPDHVIVRHAESVLNAEISADPALGDGRLRERLDYALRMLHVYGQGFQQIRATQEIALGRYPSGM